MDERIKVRRTVKHPFVADIGEQIRLLDNFLGESGQNIIERRWYNGVGCVIFDGLCINQADFSKIDCAQCIKSTFESFIDGCEHRGWYVDNSGTRRCIACKDAIGQDENADVHEDSDAHEEDDPPEEDDVSEEDAS